MGRFFGSGLRSLKSQVPKDELGRNSFALLDWPTATVLEL
jgi:hypothetical protein